MKTVINFILVFAWLCPSAQDGRMGLEIGQQFPDNLTLNYHGQPTSLRAFRGQNIILDFFNSDCAVCFKNMPKIDSLQRLYKGDIRFIMVGKEDGKVQKIYERFGKKLGLKLDNTFDSTLSAQLNLPGNPIYVWIDKAGIVRAISSSDKLRSDSIDRFLAGHSLAKESFDLKSTSYTVRRHPEIGGPGMDGFLMNSYLTGADSSSMGNMPPSLSFYTDSAVFDAINLSKSQLYFLAFFKKPYWTTSDKLYGEAFPQLYIEKDLGLQPEPIKEDGKQFCFGFQTAYSHQDTAILRQTLALALTQYFGYTASVRKIMLPYYSLQLINPSGKLQSKGGLSRFSITASSIDLSNVKLDTMFEALRYYIDDPRPYINETGIDYPVDLKLEAALISLKSVNEALHGKGFTLVEKQRVMSVIVLRPTDHNVTGTR